MATTVKGGSGKNFSYDAKSGAITVNNKTIRPGEAGYAATRQAANADTGGALFRNSGSGGGSGSSSGRSGSSSGSGSAGNRSGSSSSRGSGSSGSSGSKVGGSILSNLTNGLTNWGQRVTDAVSGGLESLTGGGSSTPSQKADGMIVAGTGPYGSGKQPSYTRYVNGVAYSVMPGDPRYEGIASEYAKQGNLGYTTRYLGNGQYALEDAQGNRYGYVHAGYSPSQYQQTSPNRELANENRYLQQQREVAQQTGNQQLLHWVNTQQAKLDEQAKDFAYETAYATNVTSPVDWRYLAYDVQEEEPDTLDMETERARRAQLVATNLAQTQNATGTSAAGTAQSGADGRIYLRGESGKQYVYNPASGGIGVLGANGQYNYLTPGLSGYAATRNAMQTDTGLQLDAAGNASSAAGMAGTAGTSAGATGSVGTGGMAQTALSIPGMWTKEEYAQMLNEPLAGLEDAGREQDRALQQMTEAAVARLAAQETEVRRAQEEANRAAYLAYAQASDPYGAVAESNASLGLGNSGYAESSQVALGNTYQNALNANAQTTQDALLELELAKNEALAEGDLERANAAMQLEQNVAQGYWNNVNALADYATNLWQMNMQRQDADWQRAAYEQELAREQEEQNKEWAWNMIQNGIVSQVIADWAGLDYNSAKALAQTYLTGSNSGGSSSTRSSSSRSSSSSSSRSGSSSQKGGSGGNGTASASSQGATGWDAMIENQRNSEPILTPSENVFDQIVNGTVGATAWRYDKRIVNDNTADTITINGKKYTNEQVEQLIDQGKVAVLRNENGYRRYVAL